MVEAVDYTVVVATAATAIAIVAIAAVAAAGFVVVVALSKWFVVVVYSSISVSR